MSQVGEKAVRLGALESEKGDQQIKTQDWGTKWLLKERHLPCKSGDLNVSS